MSNAKYLVHAFDDNAPEQRCNTLEEAREIALKMFATSLRVDFVTIYDAEMYDALDDVYPAALETIYHGDVRDQLAARFSLGSRLLDLGRKAPATVRAAMFGAERATRSIELVSILEDALGGEAK